MHKKDFYEENLFIIHCTHITGNDSLIGCSDWTESEAKTFPESIVSDEYYAALRAYKQTDHQVAFGWFGGWSGEGAFMKSSLAGIPDSVDIVSIWDNGTNLSEAQRKDMAFCQNMKGTKNYILFNYRWCRRQTDSTEYTG